MEGNTFGIDGSNARGCGHNGIFVSTPAYVMQKRCLACAGPAG
jgi:hypothetical protein